MRIVFWGTYDTGKPRVRIMLNGIKANAVEIVECHRDVWGGIEDKSQVSEWRERLRLLVRWLSSYPGLILRYLKLPRHDAVIVCYMGHLDTLVLWPFAKLRKVPIIWDAFLSLYNTVVEDRKLVTRTHPLAVFLLAWEWAACRAADLVILDTRAHADYFVSRFKIDFRRTSSVLVGAELDVFGRELEAMKSTSYSKSFLSVLFYGQFIPLHGLDTIIQAARLLENECVQWMIIGKGQEESRIRHMIDLNPLENLTWIPWVSYHELVNSIRHADVCLGIFGDSDKASRVIPNKVFQILAMRKPLITRDSPAIRELLSPCMPGIYLIPPANSKALVTAIRKFKSERDSLKDIILHKTVRDKIHPAYIGKRLIELAENALCS